MAERESLTIIWTIENFCYFKVKTGEHVDSPIFFADILDNTKWRLALYPFGVDWNYGSNVIKLERCDNANQLDITVDCHIAYVSADSTIDVLCSEKFQNLKFRAKSWWNTEPETVELEIKFDLKSWLGSQNDLSIRCQILRSDGVHLESRFCSATTRIGVERRFFSWDIEDFSSSIEDEDKDLSVQLSRVSEEMPPLTLTVVLSVKELIYCMVHQVCFEKGHYFPYIRVSMLDASRNVVDVRQVKYWFDQSPGDKILVPADIRRSCTLPQLNITRSKLISNKDIYLPGDILSLRFEFAVSAGVVSNQIDEYGPSLNLNSSEPMNPIPKTSTNRGDTNISLVKSLQTLFEGERLCDLTLETKDVKYHVHKVVLCARSPFFCRLFENWRKKQGDVVYISDVKAATVRHMLQYLYYDVFEVSNVEIATQLYSLADQYEIGPLKERCLSFLKRGPCLTKLTDVSVENIKCQGAFST